MRSQVDILRDYADLIKNAGSEQERLLLAFKAFDTEGAALVNALRNGAAGLTAFMQKADEAGGVLRDELIREMERVDDEFAKLARTVGVTMKRAVLDLVAAFGELGDADPAQTLKDVYKDLLRQRENISGELQLARSIGDNALAGELQQTIGALDARLKAIQDERRLRATTGDVGPGRRARRQPVTAAGEPVTIVPDKTRDSATRALANQQKAVLNLIAALELEQAALGKTAAEQRVMIELARAGEAATEGQKDQIRSLVNEIEAQRAAQERVNDITRFGGDLMYDQWGQIASSIQTGNAALDRFLQTMLDVTAQAVIFGEGPLASLLGGGKAGGAGGLLGLLFGGARAQGGPVSPGRAYMVGEKGPEMIVPKQAGTVIPNHALSGGGVNFSPVTHIDARGSNLSEAQLQTILDERDRRLIPAAVQAVGQSNRFNTNPAFR